MEPYSDIIVTSASLALAVRRALPSLLSWCRQYLSDRVTSSLTRANPHALSQFHHKYLAIADCARLGAFDNRINRLVDEIVIDGYLQPASTRFGQKKIIEESLALRTITPPGTFNRSRWSQKK